MDIKKLITTSELSDEELCEEVARIQKLPNLGGDTLRFFNPITHPHQLFPLIEQYRISIEWVSNDNELEDGVVVCLPEMSHALYTDNIKQLPQLILMLIIEARG